MSGTRQDRLDLIRADNNFDVVVIGGGVNGIGTYRELALQGLRVLLVERSDFASGCSAAPSRMIHGGLRYLENGEFDLVRESLRERDALLRNAPHLVQPLPTVIPVERVFSGLLNAAAAFTGRGGRPSSRGAVPIKLGLSLYDWVTRQRRMLPPHRFFGKHETVRKWPALTRRTRFSAVYYDAWISHPERFCIEMITDMERAAPSCIALNYAQIDAKGESLLVTCTRTGDQLPVRTRSVVNATGAWLDDTARALGRPDGERMVSGTKGSHLILDNAALETALGGHMVYFENADGRVCIVFPYLGKVLAGSTDIRVDKARQVRCEEEERDYILASLCLVFPEIAVTPEQVVFSYSGIRPLPKSEHDFTGRISRGHEVRRIEGKVPQVCMIGGKWTTFRSFAEQTAEAVLAELGLSRCCHTRDLPIGGGKGFPDERHDLTRDLMRDFGIDDTRARHLADRYGTAAPTVQRACQAVPEDGPISPGSLFTRAEIAHLIRTEHVETLPDLILRRTDIAITGALSAEMLDSLAGVLAETLGLSPDGISSQKQDFLSHLASFHGVSPDTLITRNNRSKICASAARPA